VIAKRSRNTGTLKKYKFDHNGVYISSMRTGIGISSLHDRLHSAVATYLEWNDGCFKKLRNIKYRVSPKPTTCYGWWF